MKILFGIFSVIVKSCWSKWIRGVSVGTDGTPRNANQTDPEVRRLSSAAATRDARCHIVVSLSLFDSGGGGIWVSLNLSILRFLRYSASGKIQTRKREEERGVRRGRLLPEIEMWREGRGRGGQAGSQMARNIFRLLSPLSPLGDVEKRIAKSGTLFWKFLPLRF